MEKVWKLNSSGCGLCLNPPVTLCSPFVREDQTWLPTSCVTYPVSAELIQIMLKFDIASSEKRSESARRRKRRNYQTISPFSIFLPQRSFEFKHVAPWYRLIFVKSRMTVSFDTSNEWCKLDSGLTSYSVTMWQCTCQTVHGQHIDWLFQRNKQLVMCVCSSDLALIYNDRAVLENYHSSAVFRLMKDEGCSIISSLKKDEYK